MDKIIVISPEDIEAINAPVFGEYNRPEEESYLAMLMAMQPLVEEYERTGAISSDMPTTFDDMTPEWKSDFRRREKFKELFLSSANWITVERNSEGRYVVVNNGRRRMYIAKKYSLRLPVCMENG